MVAIAIAMFANVYKDMGVDFKVKRFFSICSKKLQGFHDYFASQVKVMSIYKNMVATFSTPIAVVAAAVSSDINDFSVLAGIRD